jgi:rhamnosyl/mannosyltransferase
VTSKLRVLQLGKYYYPHSGGIETHLRLLTDALSATSEVEVLVHNTARSTVRERVGSVDVTRVATLALASTEFSPALVRELSGRSYDVLHLHTPNPMGMLAYYLAKKPVEHRLIVTHHSDVVRQIWLRRAFQPVFAGVMRRADAIVVTSKRYLDTSLELKPYREKCVVIPYGIPLTEPGGPVPSVVDEFSSRHGGRVILCIGRLVYYKGFEVILAAMARVDAGLLIVGRDLLSEAWNESRISPR